MYPNYRYMQLCNVCVYVRLTVVCNPRKPCYSICINQYFQYSMHFSGNCKPSSHLCFSLLHVNIFQHIELTHLIINSSFLMQIMLLSFQVFFVVLIKTGNTSSCLYTW